jgi:hypothetical protein
MRFWNDVQGYDVFAYWLIYTNTKYSGMPYGSKVKGPIHSSYTDTKLG